MGDNTEMGTLAVTEELHAKQQEALHWASLSSCKSVSPECDDEPCHGVRCRNPAIHCALDLFCRNASDVDSTCSSSSRPRMPTVGQSS
jgi:hypothetical protein